MSGWDLLHAAGRLSMGMNLTVLTDCSVRSTDPLVCLFQVFPICSLFGCGLLGMQCVWESLPGGLR